MNRSNKTFWKVAIKIVLWCCQISWQALHESRHQKRFNKHILTLSRHSITFESEVILIFVTVSMYQLSNSRVSWSEILYNFFGWKVVTYLHSKRWESLFFLKKWFALITSKYFFESHLGLMGNSCNASQKIW